MTTRTILKSMAGAVLPAVLLTGSCTQTSSTEPPPPGSAKQALRAPADLFPATDMMRIGVYYYPEAWPKEQWPRDIANIKKLNLEFVHMGEFAWAFMEPKEGQFDFDWLEQNVKLCADNGLKVILCTPSPAPPVWLGEKHPEVLMVDAAGRTMLHGTRQQGNWTSPVYRHYVSRVVDELGKRFGNNPAVWGWQLDNELSHYGKEPSFDEDSQKSFRAWLKKKYGTIDNLNRDWGNQFWSQMYQNFDQIRLPNEKELVAQINPHQVLDSRRWFADEAADYLKFQTDILRKYCGHRQFVTTNFMQGFDRVNPALSAKDFEIITWTIYPAHGNLNDGPLGYRLGSAAEMSFAHDFMRSINGYDGIMELQPGQVNWGEVNPQPYPGAVYMWLMRAFAADAKLVCTYRYRQPLLGAEMYHYGLVGPDGVTPTTGGQQYQQAAKDIALLRTLKPANPVMPAAYAARKTAILYNFDNRWDLDNHTQSTRWSTMGHMFRYYTALKCAGAPVDVITEDKDFSTYPFVIAPAYQLVDEKLVARWRNYAENGGNLVLTCRTGQKDRRGALWEGPWQMPILDLIGGKVSFYDTLPAPNTGHIAMGDQTYPWISWGEILAPGPDATVLAKHTDQYYAGSPAAMTRKLGKGSVTYIGVDSENGAFEQAVVRGVFERAGVTAEKYDPGFLVDWRDGFWVATNFTEKNEIAPAPQGAKILAGTREMGPAGVAVWGP